MVMTTKMRQKITHKKQPNFTPAFPFSKLDIFLHYRSHYHSFNTTPINSLLICRLDHCYCGIYENPLLQHQTIQSIPLQSLLSTQHNRQLKRLSFKLRPQLHLELKTITNPPTNKKIPTHQTPYSEISPIITPKS
jgi:hypothetical protein